MNKLTILSLYQRLTSPTGPWMADLRNLMIKAIALIIILLGANQAHTIIIPPHTVDVLTEVVKLAAAIGITAQATTPNPQPTADNPQPAA
jgi:hypothetical protein